MLDKEKTTQLIEDVNIHDMHKQTQEAYQQGYDVYQEIKRLEEESQKEYKKYTSYSEWVKSGKSNLYDTRELEKKMDLLILKHEAYKEREKNMLQLIILKSISQLPEKVLNKPIRYKAFQKALKESLEKYYNLCQIYVDASNVGLDVKVGYEYKSHICYGTLVTLDCVTYYDDDWFIDMESTPEVTLPSTIESIENELKKYDNALNELNEYKQIYTNQLNELKSKYDDDCKNVLSSFENDVFKNKLKVSCE